jgi:hypothetical protein
MVKIYLCSGIHSKISYNILLTRSSKASRGCQRIPIPMNFGKYDRSGSWWTGKDVLTSFIAAKTTLKILSSSFSPHLKPVPFPGVSHQPDDHIQPAVLQNRKKIYHTCATTTFRSVFATAEIPRKLRV